MKLRELLGKVWIGMPEPVPALTPVAVPTAAVDIVHHDAIKGLLEMCAKAFVPRGMHVRANVMTFSADGTRRQVNAATAFNMENDPDRHLEIDATAAASGKAVTDRRAAVADLVLLQITAAPTWGLRAHEQARVRPTLKSILSVPVFNPRNVDGPLLGTLQVDTDLTLEEAGFNKPEAARLLQQFADVLSMLMIGVDVRLATQRKQSTRQAPNSRVNNATQVEPGLYVANGSTSIFQLE
jgi:hypothetical protein